MKCHYEVLGVPRTANDDDIKKSYRKLALRWHPDKNLDNPEEANEQFLLVQAAYDVLSDVHERAWYDNHREQVLRGGHTDYEDTSLDVFPFFTTSCFRGYGDDEKGFYAVYADVFRKLATEEIEFLDAEGEFETIPEFGGADSDYETVVRLFYGHWESFCTKKSYAWLNPHNIAEIRDRRILKVIEKDNRKVQQKARKERNEEIRNLVLFVKKRDRRVQAYKKYLEEKASQNRLKSQQNQLEQIRKHRQEIEEQQRNSSNVFNEAYEEQLRKLEAAYSDTSEEEAVDDVVATNGLQDAMNGLNVSQNENGEESFYIDDLYCVACDKMFSNKSSYENHEASRKHKSNVEHLREQMRQEHEQNGGDVDGVDGEDKEDANDEEEVLSEGESVAVKVKTKKSKDKKKKAINKVPEEDDHEEEVDPLRPIVGAAPESDDGDASWGVGSRKPKKGKGKSRDVTKGSKAVPVKEPQADVEVLASPTVAVEEETRQDEPVAASSNACVTCKEQFASKNKLFEHLKKTGHSVYVDKLKAAKAAAEGVKTKGRRNK